MSYRERRETRRALSAGLRQFRDLMHEFNGNLDALAAMLDDDIGHDAGREMTAEQVKALEELTSRIEDAVRTLITGLARALGVDLGGSPEDTRP